MEHIYCELCV